MIIIIIIAATASGEPPQVFLSDAYEVLLVLAWVCWLS